MSPIEKLVVNVSELDSPENVSTPAGDAPPNVSEIVRTEKLPRDISFSSSRSSIVKKFNLKEVTTKIPRPSSREALKEEQKSNLYFDKIDQVKIKQDKKTTIVSFARKSFRTRKSLSQMDLQRARTSSSRNSRAVVPASLALTAVNPRGETSLERSFRMNDEFFCFAGNETDESDTKLAGMKIFASIMLNAWRRRRDDVRRLSEEVNRMKKSSVRVKNQIHVLNSLFKIEQKQNDELNTRLRRMIEDQKKIQDMYDELNLSFVDLKSRNCLVEKELVIREKEYEGLNLVLGETKTQLFKCMSHERELETSLSSEQRKNQELENCKNELLNEVSQMKFEACETELKFQEQLCTKDEEITKLKSQLAILEKKLSDLKIRETQVREYEKLDMAQRKIIEELKMQLHNLQTSVQNTWGSKMRTFWTIFPDLSFKYVHFFMFYLLPAMPPPTIKSFPAPKIEKALNLIWK